MRREKAIAIGNRAGVIEWANEAWSRVTGYALEASIAKPVADLLGRAGIESTVIDFVGRRFREGAPCEIELPLEPPDGAPRWIHVSVEALRDRHGEVSHFAAIAWDVTEDKRAEAVRTASETAARAAAGLEAEPGDDADGAAAARLALAPTDLSDLAREGVGRFASAGAPRAAIDLGLPDDLPAVELDRARVADALADLLRDAVHAIGDEWGTVSVNTGIAHNEEVLVSPTYPRDCLLRGMPHRRYVYLEVHDTGSPLDRRAVDALAGRARPDAASPRAARLAAARDLARAHGGELRVDADPGFGTRAIWLFPA